MRATSVIDKTRFLAQQLQFHAHFSIQRFLQFPTTASIGQCRTNLINLSHHFLNELNGLQLTVDIKVFNYLIKNNLVRRDPELMSEVRIRSQQSPFLVLVELLSLVIDLHKTKVSLVVWESDDRT